MSVHWTQPGLTALSETDGHGDTCGPIVILDYLTLKDAAHYPQTIAQLDAMRAQLVAEGLMNNPAWGRGMTITSIGAALAQHYGVTPVKVSAYNANLDFQVFRHDLINALLLHQLVIMETSDGSALPDGQPGVQYHFVLHGGIDSDLGYWTCNGDTETALHHGGTVAPVWYGVDWLAASKPCGYLILPALMPVTPPPPPPPPAPPVAAPDVKGALADLATATAALADAAKKLEQ